MSQPYDYQPPQKTSSDLNTMGLIGLILSITGFMFIITAPVGLICSLMGLKHPQKGLAIAGTIVGIFSTLYAATIAFIMFMYFGILGSMCCFGMSMVKEQMAQEQAAKAAVAPLLNRTPEQIRIEGLSVPPFQTSQTTSARAVYTDDAGVKKEVDFSVTLDKSSGKWTATNVIIDSQPRDWAEFHFDEDDGFGSEEETTDDEQGDESTEESTE